MTAHPVNLERKVRRLDNDVQSIYELLSSIQGVQLRQTNRLDEMDRSIETLAGRVEAVEGRLEAVEGRLEAVEGRLEAVDGRLGVMEGLLREVVDLLRGGNR